MTTPIYYVNSVPHIGHLYTSVLADSTARYQHLRSLPLDLNSSSSSSPVGELAGTQLPNTAAASTVAPTTSVLLSTGTDEHGQKVADAAAAAGMDVSAFTDRIACDFKSMHDAFSVGYHDFVRTTDPRHAAVVRWLWRRLESRGHIYLGTHEGWYCQSDEAFLAENQVCSRREYLISKGLVKTGQRDVSAPAGLPSPPPSPQATASPSAFDGQQQQQPKPKQKGKGKGASDPDQQQKNQPQAKQYTEAELEVKVSAESGHTVEWLSEQNFKFRLSAFREQLLALLHASVVTAATDATSSAAAPSSSNAAATHGSGQDSGEQHLHQQHSFPFVTPESRATLIRQYVASDALKDLSVSRKRDRVPWAIPVPAPAVATSSAAPSSGAGARASSSSATSSSASSSAFASAAAAPLTAERPPEPHSVYVWLDALANYLTASALGSGWMKRHEARVAAAVAAGQPAESVEVPDSDLPIDIDSSVNRDGLDGRIGEARTGDSGSAGWRSLFPAWPSDVHVVGKDILKFHGG